MFVETNFAKDWIDKGYPVEPEQRNSKTHERQRLLEIRQQVAPVSNPDRDAHPTVGDSGVGHFLCARAGVDRAVDADGKTLLRRLAGHGARFITTWRLTV